jgi:hypothetical protein
LFPFLSLFHSFRHSEYIILTVKQEKCEKIMGLIYIITLARAALARRAGLARPVARPQNLFRRHNKGRDDGHE